MASESKFARSSRWKDASLRTVPRVQEGKRKTSPSRQYISEDIRIRRSGAEKTEQCGPENGTWLSSLRSFRKVCLSSREEGDYGIRPVRVRRLRQARSHCGCSSSATSRVFAATSTYRTPAIRSNESRKRESGASSRSRDLSLRLASVLPGRTRSGDRKELL
ncbi:hypothetical protein PFISCL1PPCAC_25989 [Pristionchus fissidentatus]|uniref:Ribosomal protein n=1 Tax=Pristionchus fissidentatus TaxID=1538716 RepID=A0AAV5WY80_9BILA|nr:hypothetical protein PFISCL1PPCAC_25989 [Pristionchus fissidentatus]